MECLKAIYSRRAVRDYKPDRVSTELLSQVVQAASQAPSGGNIQAWAFLVLTDEDRIRRMRALAPGMVAEPRAVIVVCFDRTRVGVWRGAYTEQRAGLEIGLVTQTLLLAAHAMGLGCCPVTCFPRRGMSQFLDLPESVEPIILVAVGYPVSSPKCPGRRSLTEMCFFGEWGCQNAEHEG